MQRGLQNKGLLSFQKHQADAGGENECNRCKGAKVSVLPQRDAALARIPKSKMRGFGAGKERASVWPANCNNAISILNNEPLSSGKCSFLSLEVTSRFPSAGARWGWGRREGEGVGVGEGERGGGAGWVPGVLL